MSDAIVIEPAAVLREKAKEVPRAMFGTPELTDILLRMSTSLRAANTEHAVGVALAAPQISLPWRIFIVRGYIVLDTERSDDAPDVAFINPTLVKKSREKAWIDEGCLSVPDTFGLVERATRATVRAQNEKGKRFERGGSGLLAQIFQHEIEHLDGALFIDRARDVENIRDRLHKNMGSIKPEVRK